MSAPRYLPRAVGVWDTERKCAVSPLQTAAWREYLTWLAVQPPVVGVPPGPEVEPPPADPAIAVAALRAQRVTAVRAHADQLRGRAVAGRTVAEMSSWGTKQREASAVQAGGKEADAPMLAAEARARGVPLAVVVTRVLGKARVLMRLEAEIAGVCGRHRDALAALDTIEALSAHDITTGWPAPPADD